MTVVRSLLLPVLACLALAGPLSAAEKGKKYALLVAVNEYRHSRLGPLKYTENDINGLAELLRRPTAGFARVRVLNQSAGKKDAKDAPTAANVLKALDDLLDERGRYDTVLIALSGHGVQLEVEDPDGKKASKTFGYFCPSDADFGKISYQTGKAPKLILLDDVFKRLGNSGAGTKLMLIDACRNELKADSTTRDIDLRTMTVPEGVATLFSCKSGERAWETGKLKHGVFFHFVLQGLRGKARNEKGEVTWDRLAEYVKEQVTDGVPELIGDGAKQHPHAVGSLVGKSPVLDRETEADREFRKGRDRYFGFGGKAIDFPEAASHFERAAKQGHGLARVYLGLMHRWGEGVEPDDVKAERLAKEGAARVKALAEAGDPDAQNRLGLLYWQGLGVKANAEEGTRWQRESAAQGFAPGQHAMGWAYHSGRGVKADFKEAVAWWRKAADQGLAWGQRNLGLCYARGEGVAKDPAEAVRWYRKAAEQGLAAAQESLGYHLETGEGVERDLKGSNRWYREAAKQNEPTALARLGLQCAHGRGTPADPAEAVRFWRRGAERGHAWAMSWLGDMLRRGQGVKRDEKEAFRWIKLAAERNVSWAQLWLGQMYLEGEGTRKDEADATKWLKKAAAAGERAAAEELKKLGG